MTIRFQRPGLGGLTVEDVREWPAMVPRLGDEVEVLGEDGKPSGLYLRVSAVQWAADGSVTVKLGSWY